MKLDLIFIMRDTYFNSNVDPLTKFSSSRKRIKCKKNSAMEHLGTITRISTRINISCAMERTPSFVFGGKFVETETKTKSEFPNGENVTVI